MSRYIRTDVHHKKYDNEKDNVCTVCGNINFVILFLFLRVILAVCISNCYFIGQVLMYNVSDTCNDFLVQ